MAERGGHHPGLRCAEVEAPDHAAVGAPPDHAAVRAEPGPLTGQLSLLVAMVTFIGCGLYPLFSA